MKYKKIWRDYDDVMRKKNHPRFVIIIIIINIFCTFFFFEWDVSCLTGTRTVQGCTR